MEKQQTVAFRVDFCSVSPLYRIFRRKLPVIMVFAPEKQRTDSKSCVPYVHTYVPVRWYVRYGYSEVRFISLHEDLYNGFNTPEAPNPAALGVPDIIVVLQAVFLLMLGKVRTEAFGSHRLCSVVIAPQLIDGIEILGCDLGVCFEAEVLWIYLHRPYPPETAFSVPWWWGSDSSPCIPAAWRYPLGTAVDPEKQATEKVPLLRDHRKQAAGSHRSPSPGKIPRKGNRFRWPGGYGRYGRSEEGNSTSPGACPVSW